MRHRNLWYVVLAVACVGATVYEIPNAKRIGRHILSSRASASSKGNVARSIADAIVAIDPEAAAIATYGLAKPNDQNLGGLVMRYPSNEFFLAQFAERLLETPCIDRRAALAVADRLLALSPENAHYRYFKGWILLKPPRDAGHEREAIRQFELGNHLPGFYLPYSKYQERVDRLCEEAGLDLWAKSKIQPGETGMYFDLTVLLWRSQDTHLTFAAETFEPLSAAVSAAAERLVNAGQTYPQLEHGMFLLQQTETGRLRASALSPEQAWQSRLRASQAAALNDLLGHWYRDLFASGMALAKIGLAAVVPLTLAVQLPLAWLFMVIVNFLRGRGHEASVGIKAAALFVSALLGFPCLFALAAFLDERLPGSFLASIAFAAGPFALAGLLGLLSRLRPLDRTQFGRARRWATLFCAPVWAMGLAFLVIGTAINGPPDGLQHWLVWIAVGLAWTVLWMVVRGVAAYRQHVFKALPCNRILRNRLVQTAILLLVATGILRLVWTNPVAPAVLTSITLLLVGITATHTTENPIIALDGLRRFFARDGQIVATRTKMLHLMSGILLICWAAILVGVHLSAARYQRLEMLLTSPLSLYGPIPPATRETYERVVLADGPTESGRRMQDSGAGVPEHLHLAAPEDVAAFITNRRKEGRVPGDGALLRLAVQGGRDIRPIILAAMKNPNARQAILRRAEWGDSAAKEPLVALFEKEFSDLGESYVEIRQDPNGLQALLAKARWGDDAAKTALEERFTERVAQLPRHPGPVEGEDQDRLRTQLQELVTIHETLIAGSGRGHTGPLTRTDRQRSEVLDTLLIGSNMPAMEPLAPPADVSAQQLESLLDLAGALAFVSEPQEAQARFRWLMPVLVEQRRHNQNPHSRPQRLGPLARDFESRWFYRAIRSLPPSEAAALLTEYVKWPHLSHPFGEADFLDTFAEVGNRALAEWMLQCVAESPPSKEVRDIPVGRIITRFEDFEVSREDTSHEYLESAYPYLSAESTPLLLQHLNSDHIPLRAFVVWRLTTLGYDWPEDQLDTLLKDRAWQVRLNALLASDTPDIGAALADENTIVQAIAGLLAEMPTGSKP